MKKISICLVFLMILSLPIVAQTQTQYKVSPKVKEELDAYDALWNRLPRSYGSKDTALVYLYQKINEQALLAMKNVNSDIDFIAVVDKCTIESGHMWKITDHSKELSDAINKLSQQDQEYHGQLILGNKYYIKNMAFVNAQIFKIDVEYNAEDEYFETVVHLKKKLSSYNPIEQYWIIGTLSDWFDHIKINKEDLADAKSKMKATGFEPIIEMADY